MEVYLESRSGWKEIGNRLLILSGKIGPVFALILVVAIFGYQKPNTFFTFLNFSSVAGQTVVIAVAAVGMTFIIISAGIDLSVGSVVALTGVYATMIMSSHVFNLGIGWGIVAGLITGAFCGLINGVLITRGFLHPLIILLISVYYTVSFVTIPTFFVGMRIVGAIVILMGAAFYINKKYEITSNGLAPFIATLGMMEIVRGIALQSSNGLPITYLPDSFRAIGNAVWSIPMTFPFWGKVVVMIPYSLFILIPLACLAGFILKYTVFGIQVYAIGSNEQTARLCGVNVKQVKLWVYLIGGFTAGLAGIIHASRMNTGQPSEAQGMELEIIAAVVIGGGSLMGGEGTILGSVVGAFIIKFLRNGCNLIGVSSFVQRVVIGLIIIAAVYLDQLRRKSLSEQTKGT